MGIELEWEGTAFRGVPPPWVLNGALNSFNRTVDHAVAHLENLIVGQSQIVRSPDSDNR